METHHNTHMHLQKQSNHKLRVISLRGGVSGVKGDSSLPYEEGAGCVIKEEKQHYRVFLRRISLYCEACWSSLHW